MRLLMGQPEAMPLRRRPVWQKGMPQSMQRAPCWRSFGFVQMLVKFVPVVDALEGGAVEGQFAHVF